MMIVTVEDRQGNEIPPGVGSILREIARRAWTLHGPAHPGGSAAKSPEVCFSLVDYEEMRGLNRHYRAIDEPTDVLAFSQWEGEEAGFAAVPDGATPLGDVVICLPRAREQAELAGHSLLCELALLACHGMLHLLGFDHESDEDHEAMRRAEGEVLDLVLEGREE